jgi:AcrR family transcriptional regulator
MSTPSGPTPRRRLTKERILRAAVDLADREGLGALTMRRLGAELGVEAMSLYKHVANKEEILDGVVELIVGQIEIPVSGEPWQEAMRRRAQSAREVLCRHSWAIGLLESRRSMGPATMRYTEAVLGNLRSAGFSLDDAAHAFWLLDSYVYGHVIQETSLGPVGPVDGSTSGAAEAAGEAVTMADFPNLVALGERARQSGYSVDREFAHGLDLILGAIERSAAPAGG